MPSRMTYPHSARRRREPCGCRRHRQRPTGSNHAYRRPSRLAVIVPLITRQALYGNPTRASGQVSPDGKWLSWMAPHEGVMNVWMAPASDPSAAKRMTNATDRPIPQYFWAPDLQSLLYVQDKAGDENYLLYQVNIATGAERLLTPFEKTRVQLVGTSTTQARPGAGRAQQPRPAVPRRPPARPQYRQARRWCGRTTKASSAFSPTTA